MKITDVRSVRLDGEIERDEPIWEERLAVPLDAYPEYRERGPVEMMGPRMGAEVVDGRLPVSCIFVEVETDEGVTGFAGPIDEVQAFLVDRLVRPHVVGQDPRAHERIWDIMYRAVEGHGRKGSPMQALSAVDCAVWDVKGRLAGLPVYKLLGGPLRDEVPAYASALGFSHEPDKITARARRIVDEGYRATKWFFRHGPASGPEGVEKNVELVRTVREAVGDDVDIMLDCWKAWDVRYAIAMAERIARYRPRWIEEPVFADRIDACAAVRRAIPFPVSTGEHEYTRWGFKALLDAGAADVIQPDVLWAGGITELVKICALASTYEVEVVPHAHTAVTVQVLAAQPASLCPLLEYLVNHSIVHQHFFQDPVVPSGGVVTLTDAPGLGVDIDEDKVMRRTVLEWGGG